MSIKEWTNLLSPEPSWNSKTLAILGMPTGEGVPQGLRGWGVRLEGVVSNKALRKDAVVRL